MSVFVVQSKAASLRSRNVGTFSRVNQHIRCPGGMAIPAITEEAVVVITDAWEPMSDAAAG